jgi:hypothetical protein
MSDQVVDLALAGPVYSHRNLRGPSAGHPDWLYPLVMEKPVLTFCLPRDVFIPMAGVA